MTVREAVKAVTKTHGLRGLTTGAAIHIFHGALQGAGYAAVLGNIKAPGFEGDAITGKMPNPSSMTSNFIHALAQSPNGTSHMLENPFGGSNIDKPSALVMAAKQPSKANTATPQLSL